MPPSRRDDLIEAAMRVFGRLGFHGTCLDKVLEEGGISRMTLYNHFRSKDELIVAALRRRDEIFRNGMMKFVETRASDPVGRILAIFDYLERWLADADFRGCMLINASAEFFDPASPARRVAAEHKVDVVRYVREQCTAAGLAEPDELAGQIGLLIDGAIVTAQVLGQVGLDGATPADAARQAKRAARTLVEIARAAGATDAGA